MEMIHLFSPRLLQIVYFSIDIYVLLLLLTDGEVNGDSKVLTELSDTMCTNTYPVAHDRKAPHWKKYTIHNDSATAQTCQDYCSAHIKCESVTHWIKSTHGRNRTYCSMYKISVQDLKDTGREKDILTYNNVREYPVLTTYDKDCVCLSGYEPTPDNTFRCKPCNNRYYKPNTSNDNCQECPQDRPHTAMPGSISKEDCTNLFCPPGKYLAENKTCVECPLHTYKEHNDTSKCLNCPLERPHTTMRVTTNKDSCTNLFCPPGIGLYGKVCKSCKKNEVSSNGTDPCIQAREGEEPNHDQSKFICSAGYERNKTEDTCQKCQPGYVKSESGDRQCRPCPPNSLPILGAVTCEVDRGIQVEVVIGVLLGSVAVLAAAGFAVYLYCRKHRKRPKQSPETSSEEGEAKGNDYSDDYSGESGSSNSPTIVLSTSLSDTTVITYSCTPTSDSKSIKTVSFSSLKPRERYVVVARNELITENGKKNYVQDDKNDWDEDRDGNWNEDGDENENVDKDRNEGENENGNVDKDCDMDRIVNEDENGYWNMGGNEDKEEVGNGYWKMGGNEDKDEDEDRGLNVVEEGNNVEDKDENREVVGNDNVDEDADWNKEWNDDKDANGSNTLT